MRPNSRTDLSKRGAPEGPGESNRPLPSGRLVFVLLSGCLAAGVAASAPGQAVPNGPEIQVNSYTSGFQILPDIATLPDGRAVVVWASQGSPGSDSSSTSIQARLYDRSGLPGGDQFQVNSYTTSAQGWPAVAASPSGEFVVVWSSLGSSGSDTSETSIQFQRYSASGIRLGDQFQVNTYTGGDQASPAVAADAEGNFVVAWESWFDSPGPDQYWSIQARRFSAEGLPIGAQFQVNSYGYGFQAQPAVARDPEGNFVIAWWNGAPIPTDDVSGIRARRYDSSGLPLGDEFQVNSYTPENQYQPSISTTGDGDFVVVWESYGSDGTDSSRFSVRGRRFASSGIPLGDEFQVNTYTTGDQWIPDVAVDSDGGFVVLWQSEGSTGTDTSGFSVQTRRFAADDTPLTDELQVNTFADSDQRFGAVAVDPDGNFIASWQSLGSNGSDSDAESVQAQRFDALFRDGFESADASRWSDIQP